MVMMLANKLGNGVAIVAYVLTRSMALLMSVNTAGMHGRSSRAVAFALRSKISALTSSKVCAVIFYTRTTNQHPKVKIKCKKSKPEQKIVKIQENTKVFYSSFTQSYDKM
jgi:hypothetical protein